MDIGLEFVASVLVVGLLVSAGAFVIDNVDEALAAEPERDNQKLQK